MARIKPTTRQEAPPKAQSPDPDDEPVSDNDELISVDGKGAGITSSEKGNNEPQLGHEKATKGSKLNGKAESTTTTGHSHEKHQAPKAKRIILRMTPGRIIYHQGILPVDTIMEDMTNDSGGIPPSQEAIRARAVDYMKDAYRAGTEMKVIRAAAEQILRHRDEMIRGDPMKPHSRPRGKGLRRLELQRSFLQCILDIRCEVFEFMLGPN
ncbi:hypothetical protein B0T20DRAFT_484211 [Sordaria brevicollis]|uniref:Uncharacterized protein n=1 Tax=Sordaria brevicollis TaxID=83679 RepID=A0AAE0U2P9_SORBR|nr:hypothetical protein B0T20DRAFT_484211 [Sordaria brevicollis]